MTNCPNTACPPPFPQGEPGFIADLRSFSPRRAHWDNTGKITAGSLLLTGKWNIAKHFPDPENLLETAYYAIEEFVRVNIPAEDNQLTVSTIQDAALAKEEYTITVTASGVTLAASDTEGLRRAVYYFLDMCRSTEVPALEHQSIRRKPWLKNRISRCFFGPIKRPPFNHDELTDDTDYYPGAYLDRLASEGVNGIWLTIVWKELAETGFYPVDKLRKKRIAKLRKTVEKCRLYGIKVWVFCIEPASWKADNKPFSEDMRGETASGALTEPFCIASENSQKYVRDSVYSIFRDVPHLGGMMLISLGERPTSCLSYLNISGTDKQPCADRCGLSKSMILSRILSSIRQGISDAGSDAEVLSWLYNPRANQIPEWWFTLPGELKADHILAFNFESGCSKVQDGRVYSGGDYWLSCIGPSDRFGRIAAAAKGHCQLAAKLQVGCSHELATIPFMPVPGNLYEKYRSMKQMGVGSVIQCWYFGNYPGLMNRAAGMLAFEDFSDSCQDFLRRLALPEWGAEHAPSVAEMWQKFGDAYANYPLDIQFQYYGPMHDGTVWPLHLRQVMKPLPRSWKPDAFPAGDAIGECLNSFELSRAVTLTGTLAKMWSRAVSTVQKLRNDFSSDPERLRDCDLYEALDILFNSGARILNFYNLRSTLLSSQSSCCGKSILKEMHEIARLEKASSRRMLELCRSDARLGYHSEAEVFKFYPEKLKWRIAELEKLEPLFDQLFHSSPDEIRRLLSWNGTVFRTGTLYEAQTFSWECEASGLDLRITVRNRELPAGSTREQQFVLLMDSAGIKFPLEFGIHEPGDTPCGYNNKCLGITVEHASKNTRIAAVPLNKLEYAPTLFIGLLRTWLDADGKQHFDTIPDGEYQYDPRLNFNAYFSADKLGKLILGQQ